MPSIGSKGTLGSDGCLLLHSGSRGALLGHARYSLLEIPSPLTIES